MWVNDKALPHRSSLAWQCEGWEYDESNEQRSRPVAGRRGHSRAAFVFLSLPSSSGRLFINEYGSSAGEK